jgi:mRNA interferase RelE/StbE
MPLRLKVTDETAEFLRSLHPEIKRKIRAALEIVASDPSAGKSLQDELNEHRSFRVGRFRIIFKVGPKGILEIVAIGPRKVVYEETYRLLKKERGESA